METQYTRLSMTPSGVPPVIYMSQNDIGRPIGFVCDDDLSNYSVVLEATRTDGTPITVPVTVDGNICAFETTATMTNKADVYIAQIVVTNASGKHISSIPIKCVVVLAAMDENSEGIEEDAPLYQQYTGTVQSLIADIRTQLNTEAAARQAADNTLQSNINSEASTRATADASLQSQINQLVAPSGSAPSAAEVENARVGADGTVYSTLGDAIRTQVTDVKSAIERNVLVSETPTMEDGKYINISGIIGNNSGFALSDYIKVDGVYAIYSALAKDYAIYYFTESKEKISLQNVDNATFQAKIVVLEIPENAYYFRFNDYKATLPVASCCVYKSLPDENKNNIINLNSKIDKVDDRFYDLGLIESVDFSDRETGFYLNQNCAKISYNGAFISQPVSVKAGHTIELHIASYTNMSVISKYNNGTYTPLVIGQYTDYNNAYSYTYTSTEDCDLVFSGYDRNGYYANIVTHIADTVDSLETEIDVIKNENRRNAEVEPLEIGYYINSSGSKVPLGTSTRGGVITSPIYLEKGETLTIYAMSYSIMSAIALISGTGYLPAVLGDSTYEEVYKQYTYTAPFDCSVVVSGYSQLPPYGYITKQYSVSNNPFSNLLVGAGLASAYDTMGFIGDSISSGECYSNEGGTNVAHDIYSVSWGQYLARMCGATGYNWSRGGQTSKTWIAEWSNNASFTDHPCKMYVIGLGQNDGYDLTDPRTVPLGVPADVGTDAETFYGLYSKIILRVKEIQPKAHIFVITNIIQQIEDHGYNTAIRYMASYYDNVFLLDYYTYGQELLNSPLMLSQKRLGHYTALGYRLMAQYINTYIDWYMRKNPGKFTQIEFIGTEWSWT